MESKYITKLSKEELLELHRYAVCADTKDIIREDGNSDGDSQEVTALENWPEEDGMEDYIETEYSYTDFEPPHCYDACGGSPEERERFYSWMLARFGKDYIKDYLENKGFHRDCINSVLGA